MGCIELKRPAGLSCEARRLFDDLAERMADFAYHPCEADIPQIALAAEALALARSPDVPEERRPELVRRANEATRPLWRLPEKRRAAESKATE